MDVINNQIKTVVTVVLSILVVALVVGYLVKRAVGGVDYDPEGYFIPPAEQYNTLHGYPDPKEKPRIEA